MKRIVMLGAVLVAGCATAPKPSETEAFIGRVDFREPLQSQSRRETVKLTVPVHGNYVPILVPFIQGSRVYGIRDSSGKLVLTQTTQGFDVGACVTLWHEPYTRKSTGPDYVFLEGTLERSTDCP